MKTETEFAMVRDQLTDILRDLITLTTPLKFEATINPKWKEDSNAYSKWKLTDAEEALVNSYRAAGCPMEGSLSWPKKEPPVICIWTTLGRLNSLVIRLNNYVTMEQSK